MIDSRTDENRFELVFGQGSSSCAGSSGRLDIDSTDMWDLKISGDVAHFSIKGATIRRVWCSMFSRQLPIKFVNCQIGELKFAGERKANVELVNSWIGSLSVDTKAIKTFTVVGGGIANIDCPPADGSNPFVGDVQIADTVFPISKHEISLFQGPQAYRSLHSHLMKHDNILAANLMRALQLRSERSAERGFSWIVNCFYGTFANYGTNPGRPLVYLFVFYVITAAAIYRYDGGELPLPIEAYTGAYSIYLDWNGGWLNRSFLLPLQSILNPFSMFFDVRRYVIPDTWQMNVWLTVQGLFSDFMLLLVGLSIRRRFKPG